MNEVIASWGLILVASMLNSYASLIVKFRFNQLGKMELHSIKKLVIYLLNFFRSLLVISAVIAFLLSPLCWFAALNKIQLSVAIPVQFSMHLLLVLIFSVIFLKERLSFQKVAGVLCIAVSLYLLYKS